MIGKCHLIVAIICRETKEMFYETKLIRKTDCSNNLILSNLSAGSCFITDIWRGYNGLNSLRYYHIFQPFSTLC